MSQMYNPYIGQVPGQPTSLTTDLASKHTESQPTVYDTSYKADHFR